MVFEPSKIVSEVMGNEINIKLPVELGVKYGDSQYKCLCNIIT